MWLGPYRLGWDLEPAERFTTAALGRERLRWFWVRKRYPDEYLEPELRELYLASVGAVQDVRVPHAVPVCEPVLWDSRWHEVEEMVPGVDLTRILETQMPVRPEAALRIVSQLCDALKGMARVWRGRGEVKPFVYGHLEPRRVLVSALGDVWLRRLSHHAWMTRFATDVISTSRMRQSVYSAPEVLRGVGMTPQADVFSLGVLLYELLTGHHPFLRETGFQTFLAIMEDDRAGADVPLRPEFGAVLDRAMAHEPSERYPTAEAFGAALQGLRGRTSARRPERAALVEMAWPEVVAWFARAPALAHDTGLVKGLRRRMRAELGAGAPSWSMLYALSLGDEEPEAWLPGGEGSEIVAWLRGTRQEAPAKLEEIVFRGVLGLGERAKHALMQGP